MSTAVKRISTGYSPRAWQAHCHRSFKRFNVLVLHRRAGKTTGLLNEIVDRAFRNQSKNPVYAYIAPTYQMAKRIAWQMLKQIVAEVPGLVINEAELRVDIPRPAMGDFIRIMLLGAENPSSLKGIYLDGVVLDEYGSMAPDTWTEAIRPTLIDRQGWAIFAGTPVGQNHFFEAFEYAMKSGDPEWFGYLLRASESKIIPQSELDSLKREMSESEYEQELECSFAAGLVGAYWGKEMETAEREGRLTEVPYDKSSLVTTYWDLGVNDVTAIWFMQCKFGQWRAIDYMQAPDTGLEEWAALLQRTKYVFGRHHFPHDLNNREMTSAQTRYATARKLFGSKNIKVIPRVKIKNDSIQAGRRLIAKTVFDVKKCAEGIKCLRNYQRRWDSELQQFSPKPLHNFASNGADAWQQFAMAADERPGRHTLAADDDEDDDSRGHVEAETYFNPFARR